MELAGHFCVPIFLRFLPCWNVIKYSNLINKLNLFRWERLNWTFNIRYFYLFVFSREREKILETPSVWLYRTGLSLLTPLTPSLHRLGLSADWPLWSLSTCSTSITRSALQSAGTPLLITLQSAGTPLLITLQSAVTLCWQDSRDLQRTTWTSTCSLHMTGMNK